jgi:hypothetical protein
VLFDVDGAAVVLATAGDVAVLVAGEVPVAVATVVVGAVVGAVLVAFESFSVPEGVGCGHNATSA